MGLFNRFVAVAALSLPLWSGCAADPSLGGDPTVADDGSAGDADDDDGKEDAAVSAAKVCAKTHSGTTAEGVAVTICDTLYPSAPRVRPPGDTLPASGTSTIYMAIDVAGQLRAVDRRGKEYVLVDSKGAEIELKGTNVSALPATLHMPSNRNMYLIYRLKGTIGTYKDPTYNDVEPSFHITSAKVVIEIAGKALDTAMEGPWEGVVSERTGSGKWDDHTTTPIRMTFTKLETANALKVWDTNTKLKDGAVYQIDGAIDNLTTDVAASDGSCMPSMKSLAAKNPFYGATKPALFVYRLAAMHFAGDQVLVMSYPEDVDGLSITGMGQLGPFSPAGLIQLDPDSDFLKLSIMPHGYPSGHHIQIHPVDGGAAAGGGGACK